MFEDLLGLVWGAILWIIKSIGWVVKTIVDWIMILPKEVMALLVIILGIGVVFFMLYQQMEHTVTSRVTFWLIAAFLIIIMVFVLANLAGLDIFALVGG